MAKAIGSKLRGNGCIVSLLCALAVQRCAMGLMGMEVDLWLWLCLGKTAAEVKSACSSTSLDVE